MLLNLVTRYQEGMDNLRPAVSAELQFSGGHNLQLYPVQVNFGQGARSIACVGLIIKCEMLSFEYLAQTGMFIILVGSP